MPPAASVIAVAVVEMPSLTEDTSRAVEEALNVPPMFTPSTAAAVDGFHGNMGSEQSFTP